MEDYSKTAPTQSTGFYQPHFNTNSPSSSPPSQFSTTFQTQSSNSSQLQGKFKSLTTKTLTLFNQTDKLRQLSNQISTDCTVQQYQHQLNLKYDQLQQFIKQQQQLVKNKIHQQTNKIYKQIQQLDKNKSNFFKQTNQNIINIIYNLKQLTNKYFTDINKKQHYIKFGQLKQKLSTLKKQTIAYKNTNNLFKTDIFNTLNIQRHKLHTLLNQQQTKRHQFNAIIQNLMQKSCAYAQRSLRRKLL